MAGPVSSRRRQRSVRVTTAVLLLGLATVVVVAAVSVATVPALVTSSLVSLTCGWAAARIMWTEITQSRRSHARDRAAQAQAFRVLFTARSSEHAAFATAMTDRLVTRDREVRELEGTLRLSEARATEAEDRVRRESRRANQAQERVGELEELLAIQTAEQADELASWDGTADLDTVVDLLAWEDRTQAASTTSPEQCLPPLQGRLRA